MTQTPYPVAETAEAALRAPRGFAVRAREAEAQAGGRVAFATEATGPVFDSREAAQATYATAGVGVALAAGWGRLTQVAVTDAMGHPLAPARPVYAEGRRWPAPPPSPPARWRLWVSYWRIGVEAEAPPDQAARRLRRAVEGGALASATLNALARQPLRPVRPQQPLDIGLFETRRPEDPDLIIPDE